MNMIQDGVNVFCSIGYCKADDAKRNPEDIEECRSGMKIVMGTASIMQRIKKYKEET